MSRKINVLIFPCGTVNALELHLSLKDCVSVNVFGGASRYDHGFFAYKNYIRNLPFTDDPDFIDALNCVCDQHEIDVILPTHDTAALILAENTEKLRAKPAVPGFFQAKVCRFKNLTYGLFLGEDFCPVIYRNKMEIRQYPVFIKPVVGAGGQNTRTVFEEKDFICSDWSDNFLVLEFLPGEELTVDCFTDKKGRLLFAGPRKRNRVSNGISMNSTTIPLTEEVKRIAESISEKMKLRGLWYFQLKKDSSGSYKLLEVSVRASGTMSLYRNLGVNFALLTVHDLMDKEVSIIRNDFELEVDRTLTERFKADLDYKTVYIDFDDTITQNGFVNPFVMMFLYGERNKGKIIKVITRHDFEFDITINRLQISKLLFDQIIHIGWNERKYHFINPGEEPIFIDNSFAERMEVKQHLNIPVFDVDAVQCLIDWRG